MLTVAEKTKEHPLHIYDCGLVDYRQILQQQHELHDKRRRGEILNTILITEHTPTVTLGARQSANKLQVSRESLNQQHIDVVDIRRGGGTTAHNPGQLVVYPILHLQELDLGISEYIRELETIGAELLEELGVKSQRRKDFRGLWIDNRKIASIGVRAPKLVTYHGLAINIQNDLSIFDFITPCGLDGVKMTSVLKETGKHHSMTQIKKQLSQLLIKHFSTPNETQITSCKPLKQPPWIRRLLPDIKSTEDLFKSLKLNTVCWYTSCSNRGECWKRGTATVLILGNICTRSCGFCSVATGKPEPPDPAEPQRLAEMAEQMGLKYMVITSVDRDDLPDCGAGHFRDCINQVRQRCPDMKFEILTPDFRNCQARAIEVLRDALPFVFAHNIETVPSKYPIARTGGDYQRSLNLLRMAKETLRFAQGDSFDLVTKSSIMLGLGETDAEVEKVLKDLRDVGCDRITIGQYLKSSKDSLDVLDYIKPEKFDSWKQISIDLGFSWVMSSPFARSSYFAEQENTIK
jgi:lipoic acid synthetase